MTKKCSKCGVKKDLSEFYIRICGRIETYCRKCETKRAKIYRLKLPPEIKKERNKKRAMKEKHTLGKRFSNIKYDAKKANRRFDITKEKFVEITSHVCFYCGKFTEGTNFTGIDRIDSSKGYIKGNIRPCCEMCNKFKLDHTTNKFIKHCEDIVNYQKKKRKK